ncbi:Alkyl hydroperoxide reductase AhpD [Symmachiella macrocystis]|uniref:Alkyl hydroperoxide reductase AhpD n=1 Tax=Symmachiella macrocystis TaxID=2527985 RepID=A0A5C6BKT7_9PLAN|nr:carboxymuconolactone decarboxylase family protein [Symmachiella macrocystis]TWU12362.1 Alkyl hydroperoxide reductase AhpD [Symmachiella macrocystis]
MSLVQPLPEADAVDKTAQTYGRIKEMFGSDTVPEPFLTYGGVPAFLQDFYMNFKKFVWTAGKLDEKTKAIIGLAVSVTKGNDVWTKRMQERILSLDGTEQEVADVLAVAATCGMYNIFFKFRDIAGSDIFNGMSVGLRAHTFANTTLDDSTVELINIAISDMNGCKPCTSGHVEKARQLGLNDEQILEAVQCAATMAAGADFLNSTAL